jgi:hypothetical protein
MLNGDFKLNPHIFNKDVELTSMRQGFGEGMVLVGDANKDVVARSHCSYKLLKRNFRIDSSKSVSLNKI